jgi:periplasmic mercuric ion binding protein
MKNALVILIVMLFVAGCGDKKENLKVVQFKVWGNCDMCKKTIETSINTAPEIYSANWNIESKIIKVEFDSVKTNQTEIQNKIAAVGYDTEKTKGDDTAYAQLHACCQYERRAE